MRRLLPLALLLLIAGGGAALTKEFFLSRGVQGGIVPTIFTSITMPTLTFTTGTSGTVGTATAALSTGQASPTWDLQNSGFDSVGAQCNDYSAYFTVANSTSLITSTAPSGPALTTSDGTWTWGTAASGRPGEYNVLLNGVATGIGTEMDVSNGVMYVNTASQGWFAYNNGFSNSGPAPVATNGPTGIVSVNATAPVQSYPGTCLRATQAGVGNSPFSKAFTLVGTGAVGPVFTQVALSNLSFPSNTAGTVGTATSTVSSGVNSPTWSIKTSGVDHAGAQCSSYPYFSVVTSGVPTGITFSPPTPSLLDSSPAGTLIATASVAMSNGPAFSGNLTSSNTNLFAISGLNINTARAITTADSGTTTSITATQNGQTGLVSVNASAPGQNYPGFCLTATQTGVTNSPYSQAFTLIGTGGPPPPVFTNLSMTGLNFSAGTASTVGTASATVSSGTNAPTWSIKTSGVDTFSGATCNNNSVFSVNSATGVVSVNSSGLAQSYSGTCLQATQAGVGNSPYSKAFTIVGTTPVTGLLTTFTFQNLSGATLPAGTPISFGQGFRYGDIMPGQNPVIRDASTHTPLPGQQWDEISTWRENGSNGSWRHAVWSAWLPNSLANGATYQVEFVATAGSYSETSKQALSVLCSGPAAHDLKIHLSDVRNQADTVRDSGDATFRVCDNIANVGRDAPRHIRAGNVYDEYVVSGMFVYATSGNKDPLLYAACNIDIFTQASDGVSPGDVRWVCEIHNAWMNVAGGSTGNAGNIGPAGFANDPQSISYKPEVLDGAASVLNWTGLDATISSASNPIQPVASAGCYGGWGDAYCMDVPTATGANSWYAGMAVRPSCSGTCPAGMNNNQLYYVAPTGIVTSGSASTKSSLVLSPNYTYGPVRFMTASQGTGTTTFGFRVQHYHWNSVLLLDQTNQDNWSPVGTTTRVTRKVYPAFTSGEKLYWEKTGLIIPMDLAQSVNVYAPNPSTGNTPYYNPNTIGNVIGGVGGGDRPDLGIISEWAAQAFINGSEANWDYARLFTLGNMTYGNATLLNEATGRIPVINNGPPIGPGGNGTGGTYAGLGAPMPTTEYSGLGPVNMVGPPASLPNANYPATSGQWTSGTYISHMPSFNSITYEIFGDRHWLDMMRLRGNADYAQQRAGPGPELGQGYYRDNNAKFTDGNTYHYYGILIDCCQGRGQAWMTRDVTYPAAFGGDNDIERSYYNDILTENRHYYSMWLRFKDGPSQAAPNNTNYSTSITEPTGYYEGISAEPFIETYLFDSAWNMLTWLHEPLASTWMKQWQRNIEGNCGSRLTGAMPYYCFDYYYSSAINNGGDGSVTSQQGSTGLYANGVDASDFGIVPTINLLSGGQWSVGTYIVTVGDQVMAMTGYHGFFAPGPIDQLAGNRYYSIIGPVTNVNGQNHTFYIQCTSADHTAFPSQCPVAGQAFTGYTSNGVAIANTNAYTLKLRLTYDNTANTGVGYSSINYMEYGGQRIIGLKIAGYNVANSLAAWDGPRLGGYNSQRPINNWDRTVVIPGLPTAVNSIP
jgi:hypothetical protein